RIDDDVRTAVLDVDRHDVEPARPVVQVVAREVVDGHLRDATLFPRCNGGRATAAFVAVTGVYFDEDDRFFVMGDDVDFAESGAITARENCVPAAFEFRAGEVFAHFSEGLPLVVFHDPNGSHVQGQINSKIPTPNSQNRPREVRVVSWECELGVRGWALGALVLAARLNVDETELRSFSARLHRDDVLRSAERRVV